MSAWNETFVWKDGEGTVASESVFHGRRAWVNVGTAREPVIFHEWKGWVSGMEFFGLELSWGERTYRGGE